MSTPGINGGQFLGRGGRPIVAADRGGGEVAGPKGVGLDWRGTLRLLRESLEGFFSRIGLLAAASTLAALSEAATVACLMAAISAMSSPERAFTARILGQSLTLGWKPLLALAPAFIALRTMLQGSAAYLSARITTDYEAHRKLRLFNSFVDASWALQSREKAGHLQNLMTINVSMAARQVVSVTTGTTSLVSFLVLVGSAFLVNWLTVAAVVVAATAAFLLVRPLSTRAQRMAFHKTDTVLGYAHEISQSVSMVRDLRVFDITGYWKRRVAEVVDRIRRFRRSATVLANLVPILYQNISALLVLAVVGVHFLQGGGDLASLGTVVILLVRALSYSQDVQGVYHHAKERIPYLLQTKTIEEQYRASMVVAGAAPLGPIESLAFEKVSFCYDPPKPTLREIDFRVEPGEIIGVVGPSGSGKSTFVQLLLRLREPYAGRYLVNRRPASDYSLSSWFARLSFVPQEPQLIDESILENILFHRAGLSREDGERAAKLANIHDEILTLPGGYDAPAGDRGSSLSGGQRQRICIARALCQRPDVIVFDEPTSALDIHSEVAIQDTLKGLRGRTTLFIIAHRLSTLSICDRIMVFREGSLQSFAPASELAASDPYYSDALKLSGLS
jgi:ATP-binding cassette, subfamily B, bacterial